MGARTPQDQVDETGSGGESKREEGESKGGAAGAEEDKEEEVDRRSPGATEALPESQKPAQSVR